MQTWKLDEREDCLNFVGHGEHSHDSLASCQGEGHQVKVVKDTKRFGIVHVILPVVCKMSFVKH